jgi:hypothetical protein
MSMRLLAFVCAAALAACPLRAEEQPAGAAPIGGRWFVREGDDKPTYFFRDGDRFVDLFSYHQRDSNKDGIDEVRLRHEPGYLVVESQGYPNHPTAPFPNSGNPNAIRVQEFTFHLPLEPRRAEEITRVPMGPYEAVAVERAGNTVKAEFEIPEDAALGVPLDCHLEFDAGGRTRALKRNGVLRIVE